MPRWRATTLEGAIDSIRESWVATYENNYINIRDILAGRIWIERLGACSQLEIIINQMYHFFDVERENWVRWKRQYCRIERNFAKNFYIVLISIKMNIIWERGFKPPVDRATFDKLMLCYGFILFHNHWNRRQESISQRHINLIKVCYEWFNQEGQEEMRQMIDLDDSLHNHLPKL